MRATPKTQPLLEKILTQNLSFAIWRKESGDITLVTGPFIRPKNLDKLERISSARSGQSIQAVSMLPYNTIEEKGFAVHANDSTPIRTLLPEESVTLTQEQFDAVMHRHSRAHTVKPGSLNTNMTDAAFTTMVENVIHDDIGGGRGCNFLLSRNTTGTLVPADGTSTLGGGDALSIFNRLLHNEYGAYMTYCFYDGEKIITAASPERHVTIDGDTITMTAISGTLRKIRDNGQSLLDLPTEEALAALKNFLTDHKEENELLMVVDETAKLLAPLCKKGGQIESLTLREMIKVIHTEHTVAGEKRREVSRAAVLLATLFPPTMMGGPIEEAARVIREREHDPRAYYTGSFCLHRHGENLDSCLAIRCAEIDCATGHFKIQSGATITRESNPTSELNEVIAKSAGMLSILTNTLPDPRHRQKLLTPDVLATLRSLIKKRNKNIANFWKLKHTSENQKLLRMMRSDALTGKKILFVRNEDGFAEMMTTIIERFGAAVTLVDYHTIPNPRPYDLVILGPGPGDPTNLDDVKMRVNDRLAKHCIATRKNILGVCLGHQILCGVLAEQGLRALKIRRMDTPLQGVRIKSDLWGTPYNIAHYNSFAAATDNAPAQHSELGNVQFSNIGNTPYLLAFNSRRVKGIQAHLESVMSLAGWAAILEILESFEFPSRQSLVPHLRRAARRRWSHQH